MSYGDLDEECHEDAGEGTLQWKMRGVCSLFLNLLESEMKLNESLRGEINKLTTDKAEMAGLLTDLVRELENGAEGK